jgi:hypothetical protein
MDSIGGINEGLLRFGGAAAVVNPLVMSAAELLWWMRMAEGNVCQTCSAACAKVERMPTDWMWSCP